MEKMLAGKTRIWRLRENGLRLPLAQWPHLEAHVAWHLVFFKCSVATQ